MKIVARAAGVADEVGLRVTDRRLVPFFDRVWTCDVRVGVEGLVAEVELVAGVVVSGCARSVSVGVVLLLVRVAADWVMTRTDWWIADSIGERGAVPLVNTSRSNSLAVAGTVVVMRRCAASHAANHAGSEELRADRRPKPPQTEWEAYLEDSYLGREAAVGLQDGCTTNDV